MGGSGARSSLPQPYVTNQITPNVLRSTTSLTTSLTTKWPKMFNSTPSPHLLSISGGRRIHRQLPLLNTPYAAAAIAWAGLAPVDRVLPGLLYLYTTITTLLILRLKHGLEESLSLPASLAPAKHILSAASVATARLAWRYIHLASACVLYAYILAGGYSEESFLVIRSGLADLADAMDRRCSSCSIPTSRIGGLWI